MDLNIFLLHLLMKGCLVSNNIAICTVPVSLFVSNGSVLRPTNKSCDQFPQKAGVANMETLSITSQKNECNI